ncbi:hypothetical protein ACFQZI_01470 [Mucilaginibacter lutimaris]|uniref:Leucine-rich repeat domain-containing protein n=1 Tax=Mucilaginibacter lutimaris TaxID=931629 RepID=A0ABW2ZBP5_9SPHI
MNWEYNTIWFDQIDSHKRFIWDSKKKITQTPVLTGVEYLFLWHYKVTEGNFNEIPEANDCRYLDITFSNIKDFSGIKRFTDLKRLHVDYCLKLESDRGLADLKDTLEWLHIEQSKKLTSINEISVLSNLKVLSLNNCGPIESLNFIQLLPHLIDFRFVGTNILSGDLTPLIEHPNLKSVGFLDKRHYNFKSKAIDAIFKEKANEDSFKDYVYKGEYRTFKYK